MGENVKQMAVTRNGTDLVSNEWLKKLDQSETPQTRTLITSIYSQHDNIVAPHSSGHLPGAANIALTGIGHVELAFNQNVQQLIVAQLLAAT